ncbi:MAG: SDR family NAD(P)-dependent oxidoreductase [Elusimicrobia bacterium]|nr:SDR family NAD(P)-dependent oxidoreductase [Elusimicrobiota bacterium]
MDWKGRRVLVTGAGGFIGSHLAEELARRGAKVRALVRYNSRSHWGFLEDLPPELAKRVEVWSGDVTDPFYVCELVARQEVVFHLAALIAIPYSYVAPASYVAVNVGGTLNVLEACRRHKVGKLVHTSTSEVYGTALYTPIDEDHPLQGQSPYSASKISADKLVESFHRSFGLPAAIARPFNTYGPRQSARAVIPTIVAQVLSGRPAVKLGELSPIRDFNFVSDTVAGFLAVAASPKTLGKAVNLGSGRGVSIGETAKRIIKLMGAKSLIARDNGRVRPGASEVYRLICDNGRARRLGWRPRHSLESGLKATIDHISQNRPRYKDGIYNV